MFEFLEPKQHLNLIDLVDEAGFDVSQWGEFKGGPRKAGANPKYCYEWCFQEGDLFLFNLWYEDLVPVPGSIAQYKNFRQAIAEETGVRRARSRRMDAAVRTAFNKGLPARVIILKRSSRAGRSSVEFRLLDPLPWTVTEYNSATGDCTFIRGIVPNVNADSSDTELEAFIEGELRKKFILHRKREAKLRALKLQKYAEANGGRIYCEVPRCGFEFSATYGEVGLNYAQVHHKIPIGKAPPAGFKVALEDLAVVCANCHAMIHRDGECREIETLIPSAS